MGLSIRMQNTRRVEELTGSTLLESDDEIVRSQLAEARATHHPPRTLPPNDFAGNKTVERKLNVDTSGAFDINKHDRRSMIDSRAQTNTGEPPPAPCPLLSQWYICWID